MGVARVQARGQVTVPQEIREACGIQSGTDLYFVQISPTVFECRVLPKHESLSDIVERYEVEGPAPNMADLRKEMEREIAEQSAPFDASTEQGNRFVPRELGFLDTSIFIHALFKNDVLYPRCKRIIEDLEAGEVTGWIDPLVVHELTYVLKRIPTFSSREDSHRFIRAILLCPSVFTDDKAVLLEALARWAGQEKLGFTDAWLWVLSQHRKLPVCSANRSDFESLTNTFDDTGDEPG